MSVIESIIQHEVFRAKPSQDNNHSWFGHGLTYITRDESRKLVENRVSEIMYQLDLRVPAYRNLPNTAQDILIVMAYQLGVPGLLKLKRMLEALKTKSYRTAAAEMLDSQWAKRRPKCAKALAKQMKAVV